MVLERCAFHSSDCCPGKLHWSKETRVPITLNAKSIQREILAEVKARQSILSSQGCATKIGILLSGDGLSSQSYLRSIQKTFRDAEVGITVDVVRIPERTPVEAVLERIALMNLDPSVSSILVLHPMSGFTREEERRVFDAVDRHKDIDGMNSAMIGLLALKEPGYIPCTAEGIVELLKRSGIPVKGRHCVIIGRGPTAGIPSILALLNRGDASVSCCHAGTPREVLLPLLDQAEIVVIALGEPDLISKDMVGRGVAVITGGRIAFDLTDCPASHIALHSSVGTMAIAMLARHALAAAEAVFQGHGQAPGEEARLRQPLSLH
jgi:methylenetetrahydrofolate dehydrogenase (NADP+) / methenyltetrahydrofolate cyclohydrolase